ncbi:hypothetical protein GGR52DRAFT_537005 [Hypoxylon sp. FL1284]|nr:hypothetical protein GGR52DRAFT_537005 [Hypoxylon sp. FL1284]
MDFPRAAVPVCFLGTGSTAENLSVPQARDSANNINLPDPKPASNLHGATKPTNEIPAYSHLDRRFQIKLLDLCTEHQGVYYKSERLSDFWDMIADILSRDFHFTISGKDAERWIEGICYEAKAYLHQGMAFPRNADREDLDTAIEDWLEVEGRRKLQKGAAEMRLGYMLTFGPDKSREDHLLTEPCLQGLRENADKIKTAVSKKGKASRKTGILLVRKIEALTPKLTQNSSTAKQLPSSSSGQSEDISSLPSSESNSLTTYFTDHDYLDSNLDSTNIGDDAGEEQFSTSPETSCTLPNESLRFSSSLSPARSLSPILDAFYSPARVSPEPTTNATAEDNTRDHTSPVAELASSDTMISTDPNEGSEQKGDPEQQTSTSSRLGTPTVKKCLLLPSATKPKSPARKKTTANVTRQLKNDSNSISRRSSRKTRTPSSRNTTPAASSSSIQGQQQAENLNGPMDRLNSNEPDQSSSQKGKKRSRNPSNSPNKVHRTQYDMSSPLAPRTSLHEDNNTGFGSDEDQLLDLGLPENDAKDPETPSTARGASEAGRRSSSAIPIIDLTQLPTRDPVKKEEEPEGSVFGSRLTSQITTSLHGAVGLTEHIKEIVGRTIAQSLGDFEHRTLERLEEMRNDWRALEDSRSH